LGKNYSKLEIYFKKALIFRGHRVSPYGTKLALASLVKEKGEQAMHAMPNRIDREALWQRREQISQTVEFLRAERLMLQRNARRMDPLAYQRRLCLLDCLAGWYDDETAKIDEALELSETADAPQA
jgi:hypothetical protein